MYIVYQIYKNDKSAYIFLEQGSMMNDSSKVSGSFYMYRVSYDHTLGTYCDIPCWDNEDYRTLWFYNSFHES